MVKKYFPELSVITRGVDRFIPVCLAAVIAVSISLGGGAAWAQATQEEGAAATPANGSTTDTPVERLRNDPSVKVVEEPAGEAPGRIEVDADEETVEVLQRSVDIWSDGTRLSGDLFWPASAAEGEKLPAIVMAHGWGGTKDHLNATYAPRFAAAGFAVLTFDYRGWGESDSRLLIVGEQPAPDEGGEATVRAIVLREVINPVDHLEDVRAAVDWMAGEPRVDAERLGLWGTSFGGGHVVWTAAHDPRIDAIVAQVSAQNATAALEKSMGSQAMAMMQRLATNRARGQAPAVPQNSPLPGLRGTPVLERVAEYRPADVADRVRAATLIIDAEQEELFDIEQNGQAVYEIVKENAPAEYHVFPITHYEIYSGDWYEKSLDLETDWFRRHLAAENSAARE